MTEGIKALGAPTVRVEAIDVAMDFGQLRAAILKLQAVARLHAAEQRRLIEGDHDPASEILIAWRVATNILNDAVATIEQVQERIGSYSTDLITTYSDAEERNWTRS